MGIGTIGSSAFYTALSGMQRETGQVDQDAAAIVGGDLDPGPAVAMQVAATGYKADAKVFEVADRMSQTLLDIMA